MATFIVKIYYKYLLYYFPDCTCMVGSIPTIAQEAVAYLDAKYIKCIYVLNVMKYFTHSKIWLQRKEKLI